MSPSNSSSSPKTDQSLNAIVVTVEEKSTMTNPKQVSPQEVVPEVNNPKQASPEEVVPEVNNPKQVSPQEVVPEVNDPKQVSPQEVVPEVNNPKQVSPQEVVPEVNNPKQVSPQEVIPDVNNPKQVSPQEIVPEVNNQKQGSSQEILHDVNNLKQRSPQEAIHEWKNTEVVVSERKKTERPSFELRVLRALNKLIKKYPSKDNHALICNICKRGFPNANSLCAHQKIHKHDLEMERKLKQVEPSYSWKKPCNSYQGTSNSVDFGASSQDALSNGKHLGISRGNVRDMDIDEVMGYPCAPPYGNTSYGFSSGSPLVTHNYNHPNLSDLNRSGLSFGPFKPNGGGTNSNYPSLFNGVFTMAPPATPYRPYPSYGSLPPYSYGPHDSIALNSVALPNTLGRCSNNNNSSSQGAISLELSLGPSKWMGGGSNNNSSVYPSLINGGVTGGGSLELHMPVRPLVSRYQFYPLDSGTRNVPPPPPPPVTRLPNDENVQGSSSLKELITKEKIEVVVVDDDEEDNVVIGDHDGDQPAEV